MTTSYPTTIDTTTELPLLVNGSSSLDGDHINTLRGAVVAVETELGTNPSGSFATVKARLDNVDATVGVATVSGPVSLLETTTPALTANYGKVYAKSADSKLYYLNDAGVEYVVNDNGFTTLVYGATVNLDMSKALPSHRSLTLAGNVTFTTSNKNPGYALTIRIIADGSTRNLTFPAWTFVGIAAPTTLAANKTAILTILCWGTADTDIIAGYNAQL